MKKILATGTLLACLSVSATELKFGDLNYFLQAGQMNLAFDASIRSEDSRVDGAKDELDGYVFSGYFAYALRSDLNVSFGLQQLWKVKTKDTETSGLQNPQLGANYRLFHQADQGFNLDFGARVGLVVFDREVSSESKDGNMPDPKYSNYAQARNNIELNARAGKKWNEANEFYVMAGLNYFNGGEYEVLGGEDVDLDPSLNLLVGGYYQYRPVNEFMMTLGLVATQFNEVDGEAAGSDFTFGQHIDTDFIFKAKYLVTESTIVSFNFSQENRSDYKIKNEGASDTKVDERMALSYGMGVDFLF
jgi:hypothetical protein